MNRQSKGDFRAVKLFCMMYNGKKKNDIMLCQDPQRVNPCMNYGLEFIIMYSRFLSFNKWTTPM